MYVSEQDGDEKYAASRSIQDLCLEEVRLKPQVDMALELLRRFALQKL